MFSKVTHLNIDRQGEERGGRGRIIKALSGWTQFEFIPGEKKEKKRKGAEREGDKEKSKTKA